MSKEASETLRKITPSLDDGQFRIVSALREGRLYLAEKAGKRFVLKTSEGAKGLNMLKREYDISLRLQHPFIASTLAWEERSPIGPAIVIEYIQGCSLSEFLREKPSLQARKRVFEQLLDAVGSIHRQSVIHNDIKPENILITETDNDVKLIDFGFADSDSHYLEKGIGGTRRYASPELLAHKKTDARSDIYSLGCLMQELFPGRYRAVARKCRQSSPDKRYPNLDELKKAWESRQRSLWWMLIPAALLLAGGIYYFNSTKTRSVPPVPPADDTPDTMQVESAPPDIPVAEPKPLAPTVRPERIDKHEPESALRQAWEDAFNQVCQEMDQAGYREFLPIHLDYGTYGIDPILRQISEDLSGEEFQTISALNETLNQDYSRRLYAKYGTLPSLYDKSVNLPEDELKYYRSLVASFKKFSPYPSKDIK